MYVAAGQSAALPRPWPHEPAATGGRGGPGLRPQASHQVWERRNPRVRYFFTSSFSLAHTRHWRGITLFIHTTLPIYEEKLEHKGEEGISFETEGNLTLPSTFPRRCSLMHLIVGEERKCDLPSNLYISFKLAPSSIPMTTTLVCAFII